MNPALPHRERSRRKSGVNRLPFWFKQEIPEEVVLERLRCLKEASVHTICQEAGCPNLSFCFKNKSLTFLILGDACTRNCKFCRVDKAGLGEGLGLDRDEPYRIADLARSMGLNYVVITSVTRDDLVDGGASVFAQTIELIRAIGKNIKIEVLIPDFKANAFSLKVVLDAGPEVIAHNIETVSRLYPGLRPLADYFLSLEVLNKIKKINPRVTTKSSMMLGLGETEKEVIEAMKDLRMSRCDILTLGQYLSPSPKHYPVKEFIAPEQFEEYKDRGLELGFKAVFCGPLVRSSYRAEEVSRCMI